MPGELPQYHMFPWKYFFSTKWERSKEIKRERELFTQGKVFPYSCVLLRRFGNTPVGHALECPSSNRMHKYGNLPYNKKTKWMWHYVVFGPITCFFFFLFRNSPIHSMSKCSILRPMWKIYFQCPPYPPSSTRVKKSFGVLLCFYPSEKKLFL